MTMSREFYMLDIESEIKDKRGGVVGGAGLGRGEGTERQVGGEILRVCLAPPAPQLR